MKLKNLLKNIDYIEIKAPDKKIINNLNITGICSDSRFVSPGNLFIAKKGLVYDGSDYINSAIDAGALAIVTDMYNPFIKNIVQIIHDDPSKIEADIASNYYERPSKNLFTFGVTGTNGKTTICYLIYHVLKKVNFKAGLLGTVEYILGENIVNSNLTTPSSTYLQKYLKEMTNKNISHVALEVSSHGIAQNRIKNIDFDVAIFTNLTQDHLDYHYCIEHYADTKKKLFDSLKEDSFAIVNIDDFWSARMIENTKSSIITYGTTNKADLYADNIKFSINGLFFDLHFQEKIYKVESSLIGRFNVYNILASIAALLKANLSIDEIIRHIKTFKNAPGRLEKVSSKKNLHIFVDYAHSDDALKNVLKTLKEISKNKIITIFGCGGDRDKKKRKKMGRVASNISDYSIITNDNPRNEDPANIIKDIVGGFQNKNFSVIEDREKAIHAAIDMANEGDIILVAGKGHEKTQIFANTSIFFSDVDIAKKYMELP